jgi:hypothetical protein
MRRELALKRCSLCGVWRATNFVRCPICRERALRACRALFIGCAIVGTIYAVGIWAMFEFN